MIFFVLFYSLFIKRKINSYLLTYLGNVDRKFSSRKTDLVRYGGEGVKVDPLLRDKNLLKKN